MRGLLFVAFINPCGLSKSEVVPCGDLDTGCVWDTSENTGEEICSTPDKDADGYEDPLCSRVGKDCDDSNGEVNPDMDEICDSYNVDENCDGVINNVGLWQTCYKLDVASLVCQPTYNVCDDAPTAQQAPNCPRPMMSKGLCEKKALGMRRMM